LDAFSIRASAFFPCPYPSEIKFISLSFSLANFNNAADGSAPTESTNIIGVEQVLSL